MYDGFQGIVRKVDSEEDIKKVEDFLKRQGLFLEQDVEFTTALFHKEEVIATGSLSGRILKCIAVSCKYQGIGIMSKIITVLMNEAFRNGETHLFIYTAPKNRALFSDLGFHEIASVADEVCLLENHAKGIDNFVMELKNKKKEGERVGAIVMNANPFTLGHQYLIDYAAAKSDVLHLFVVWEERSSFPSDVRYELIKKGIRHLDNVVLHKGKDYVISNATFPSYFLKKEQNVVKVHALLDLEIFKNYIVPALGINKRFIGEEPYCSVTQTYNETMKETLPSSGVMVEEIERLAREEEIISASKVRRLIAEEGVNRVENLVPGSTYDFLHSKKAEPIIQSLNFCGMSQRVLEAKEERAVFQKQQIRLHPLPLISLTLNLPGGYFQYNDWKWLMETAIQEIDRAFDNEIVAKNTKMGKWGPEGFWSVDRPIKALKRKTIGIEEHHPVGRLFDIDVINKKGQSLSRGDLDIPSRNCICCEAPAVECYVGKRHSIEELRLRITKMIDKGRKTE